MFRCISQELSFTKKAGREFDTDVDPTQFYNNTRQFRFDTSALFGNFPAPDTDLLQLNRPQDHVLVFLRGFELEFERTDHFVQQMHASVEVSSGGNQLTSSFQTCELALKDATFDHPFGGLIHYMAIAFPDKSYPFIDHGLEFQFSNQTQSEGTATNEGKVKGHLNPEQIFFGLTSVDHKFDNSDHKLRLYKGVVSMDSVLPDGPNTKLDFALTAGLRDNSGGDFDDPYDVSAEIAIIASPN